MTEEDAKTKACCGPRNNGGHNADDDLLCVGSLCMAWRWTEKPVAAESSRHAVTDRGPGHDPQFIPCVVPAVVGVQGLGYCGLTGAPQP